MSKKASLLLVGLTVACGVLWLFAGVGTGKADDSYLFETGYTVSGRFLQYWQEHGGLAQQGYPITSVVQERSDIDGRVYTVQYFERAVFELHPSNKPPYDVLLSLLGASRYNEKYPNGAPGQSANKSGISRFFPETRHTVGGIFLQYWQEHGGLQQQGYPISEEFQEQSDLDGKPYRVQYFQRAEFEYHPENAGTPNAVLLTQLGTLRLTLKGNDRLVTAPLPGNGIQFQPAGSDKYIVWAEGVASPGSFPSPIYGTLDIRAIDLKTGLSFTVTQAPGDQTSPAIDGDTVLWLDGSQPQNCKPACSYTIRGKVLPAGEEFTVAAGTSQLGSFSIANGKVAWLEYIGTSTRITIKDLATKQVVTVVPDLYPIPPSSSILPTIRLTSRYLIWEEYCFGSDGKALAYCFRAYDLNTHQLQLAVQDTPPEFYRNQGRVPGFDGWAHYLVWADTELKLLDIDTGQSETIATGDNIGSPSISDSIVSDGIVLWNMRGDVWAMKLADRKPLLLLSGNGVAYIEPKLAGDWLYWTAYANIGIGTERFSKLLAHPLTPTPTIPLPPLPPPTAPPLTPLPIHTLCRCICKST